METIWDKAESDHSGGGGRRTPEFLPESIREEEECNSSSGSSSIEDDSDLDREEDDDDVESSSYINGSFDDAIQALEQALPIRRVISNYYNGKSKSFTSLADSASSSSIQDIAKPENAFTRKRRILLAFKLSKKISKKPKTATMHHFTPTFTRQPQINIQLPLRSFPMVNLHQCNAAKIGNC